MQVQKYKICICLHYHWWKVKGLFCYTKHLPHSTRQSQRLPLIAASPALSSRKASAEGRPDLDNSANNEGESSGAQEVTPVVYSFMVEECILAAYTARSVPCPLHADLLLAQSAPDTVCHSVSCLHLFLLVMVIRELQH